MKARLLRIIIVSACLTAAGGGCAFGQGRHHDGTPHEGVPPGGTPPGGIPGAGGPPSGSGQWHDRHGRSDGQGRPNGHGPDGAGLRRSDNAGHSSLQFGPVGRWWDDRTVVQSIGLRREQQRQMDTIFNANKPAIVSSYKTFLNEQEKLKAMNKDPNVDQTQLFTTIDQVNQARAALQKATAQMLLQIRQQMSPDQIEKLEKLP